jgi:hypothetical protein
MWIISKKANKYASKKETYLALMQELDTKKS